MKPRSLTACLTKSSFQIQFTLIDARPPVKVGKDPPCLVTGNPRQVIDTMNDMKFAMELEADEPSPHLRDPEDFL